MTQTDCPKCGSLKISYFLKSDSKNLVQFKACDDCNYEWEWKD
ncbi:hypothetical protein [Nitrosopumilus sp. K4]|nr:hypothetical protein [Nitrosopumilus sp. K4]